MRAGSLCATVFCGWLALAAVACQNGANSDPKADAGRSPNATILPAPLASAPPLSAREQLDASTPVAIAADSRGRPLVDAGPVEIKPFVVGEALDSDRLPSRDIPGVVLSAEWTWSGVAAAENAPEVSAAGIAAARKQTRHLWTIDLAELGRMRIHFDSPSFALTKYTELRARADRFGHVLVWGDGSMYRVVTPGALRALLNERRMDVSPLMAASVKPRKARAPRFGFPTSVTELSTPSGKVELEQAHAINAGSAGALLCRTLIELIGAEPVNGTCGPSLVPLHAEYTWPDDTHLTFHVSVLTLREYPTGIFATPPSGASFAQNGLPPTPSGIFLTREELAAFRARPIEPPRDRTDEEAQGAPGEGVVAVNHTDALRYLLVDGVPVAWVPARAEQYIIGLPSGRYVMQWRSFLGTYIGEARPVLVPARVTVGSIEDAGAK